MLCLFAIVGALGCAPMVPAPTETTETLNDTIAIQRYLEGRELDPIEGIWNWSDDAYQVVITKNNTGIGPDYDYIAIVTRTGRIGWRPGQVKLLLDATASPSIFTGKYYAGNQQAFGTSFVLTEPNLIETSPPVGAYNAPLKQLLIRSYPKQSVQESRPTNPSRPDRHANSAGTCFVASPDGVVITSQHVIDGATRIMIRLYDGREVPAKVIHASRSNDLAIMKVDASGLPYLPIARARTARAGDEVFTVGFPSSSVLGTQPKFTEGSISAMSGMMDEPTYMQMSIPIQPGNSGGPVVNEQGEVVGIVAATAAVEFFYRATGSLPQNVNWAIKAEYAQLLFDAPPPVPLPTNRRAEIDRTQDATCQVLAFN